MFSSTRERERLSAEVDRQAAVIEVLRSVIDSMRADHTALLGAHSALVKAHEELLEKTADAVPPTMWANVPLHTPDYEEDAQWQLENGLIDKKLYSEILEAAGFENTEIELS